MAIKSGQILFDSKGFVIDRIQTGGVSNFNIPQEKVYEVGNFNSVATITDIPELTYDIESLDMGVELEALTLGLTPTSVSDGAELDFNLSVPMDVISPFRSAIGAYDIVKGIVVPYLTLESVRYNFAVRQNAQQTFTYRGDSAYYVPGSPYYETKTLINNTLTYNLGHTAIPYTESGNTLYVLSACVKNGSGAYRRLFYSATSADGYTNTATTITTNTDWFDEGYTQLHVTYGSATAATYGTDVNEGTDVKPAAVRAKDICVYVSDGAATPQLLLWSGIQSFEATRAVTLDNNEEFCNSKYVSIDYDVPDVTGSIGVRSVDPDDLFDKIAQIANVTTSEVVGPFSSVALEVETQVKDPDTGEVLKTIYVPDARFTIPGVQARVQQKTEVTFPFTSDSGTMLVYKGERP